MPTNRGTVIKAFGLVWPYKRGLFLLAGVLVIVVWITAPVMTVTAAELTLPTPMDIRISPTPEALPERVSIQETAKSNPALQIVGALVLLAPLGYMAWKARKARQIEVTSACCVPVLDENKRPLQIQNDD